MSLGSAEPHGDQDAYGALLESVRFRVELVLAEMPESLLEARLVITREFEFEPQPEELQAIVRLAGEREQAGLCDELPLRLLAARILVGRLCSEFWDRSRLDARTLERWAEIVPRLQDTLAVLGNEVDSVGQGDRGLAAAERDWLRPILDALNPPREVLSAAQTLVPRLSELARGARQGDARRAVPGLSEREAALFEQGEGQPHEGRDSRPCLDAVAMRTVIDDELAAWDELATLEGDEERAAFVASAADRFGRLEVAYRFVSDRLQRRQDAAVAASLERFAGEIRKIRSDLFAAYRRLATVVRSGGPTARDPEALRRAEEKRREMLRKVVDAEAAEAAEEREQRRGNVSTDEVMLQAVQRMRRPGADGTDDAQAPLPAGAERLRRERRNRWILAAVAAALALAAVAVRQLIPEPFPEPIPVSLVELAPGARVNQVESLGAMMFARVADWDGFSREDRLDKLNELGRVADGKGFAVVYVIDSAGREVGRWTREGGPAIH